MSDESLELSEVQAAFRQAEGRFAELASAAADLQSVSAQLADARASVLEAGRRLAELAESNRSVSEQLANATRAIEATDPAELQARLREVSEAVSAHERASDAALSKLGEDLHRGFRLQTVLIGATLVAVAVVAVLVFVV
jgi:hypothetical protein